MKRFQFGVLLFLTAFTYSSFGNLVAKWSAENDAVDSVTSVPAYASGITYTDGHSGQAFNFNGSSFVDFGIFTGNFGLSDFSVSFWIRSTAPGRRAIFGKRQVCDDWSMWDFRVESDGS